MNFRVKRHWWMWALCILWHFVAARFFAVGIWPVLWIVILADFFIIFPDASHYNYDITNRQFTVKRIGYSHISFPCSAITAVEETTWLTYWGNFQQGAGGVQKGFGLKIYGESFGAYEITYSANTENHSRKKVIVCPKNRKEFLHELSLHVDPHVMLMENKESAFKKKKDEI